MFRHKTTTEAEAVPAKLEAQVESKQESVPKPVEESSLKELIEKNLKWSQIIYEQNRKINSKLFWAGMFGWFKFILIVAPLILSIIYLEPMLKNVWAQYSDLLGSVSAVKDAPKQNSMENLLKLFNLDPAKQEQLKALLK